MSKAPLPWNREPGEIFSEVLLTAAGGRTTFLIVEGPSDQKFFTPRTASYVEVIPAGGRTPVEKIIEWSEVHATSATLHCLGIVDEDYDWYFGVGPASQNVVKFDPRDLEGLLLRSTALNAVLAEMSSRATVDAFQASTGATIRDAIAQRAELFGRVRIYNQANNRIKIGRRLSPHHFQISGTWSYDENAMLAEAVAMGIHTCAVALRAEAAALTIPNVWNCVRGHDAITILVGGLQTAIKATQQASADKVESILRQSITKIEVEASQLWKDILAWEALRGRRLLT